MDINLSNTVESVFNCFRSGNRATHRVNVQIAEIKNNSRLWVKTKQYHMVALCATLYILLI